MDMHILLEIFKAGIKYSETYRIHDVRSGKRVFETNLPREYKVNNGKKRVRSGKVK